MNYIFVDIDGPLLPGKMHLYPCNKKIRVGELDRAKPRFDNFAVQCFNMWAKYGDAKIIFSTNWAVNGADEAKLKEIMLNNGLDFEGRYHEDILTPKKFTSERGSEVWWWLIENAKDGDKFIAVDDDTSCRYIDGYISSAKEKGYVEVNDVTGKWINVDFSDGLTWKNFIEGLDALEIDLDDINEGEFGIKKLTEEEKEKHKKALDQLAYMI